MIRQLRRHFAEAKRALNYRDRLAFPLLSRLLKATVLFIASASALVGFLASVTPEVHDWAPQTSRWVFASQIAVYSLVGLVLRVSLSTAHRTADIGGFFLLIASSYAYRPLGMLAEQTDGPVATAAYMLRLMTVDALLPWFFWGFARAFPRGPTSRGQRRYEYLMSSVTLGTGLVLLAANSWTNTAISPQEGAWWASLTRANATGPYWLLIYSPLVLGLIHLFVKARNSGFEDKARVSQFLIGFLVGWLPASTYILLMASSHERYESLQGSAMWPFVELALQALVVSCPVVALAALTSDGLAFVRPASLPFLRYVLTSALTPAISMYVLVLLVDSSFWARRNTGERWMGQPLVLASLVLVLALIATFRTRLKRGIRKVLNVQSAAEMNLSGLVRTVSSQEDLLDLARASNAFLSRELGVAASLLVRSRTSGELEDPTGRIPRAPNSHSLRRELAVVGPQHGVWIASWPDRNLDPTVTEWSEESGLHQLFPIRDPRGKLRGALAVCARPGGLPYLGRDALMLSEAADVLSLSLRSSSHRPFASEDEPEQPAQECSDCGKVFDESAHSCVTCGATGLLASRLPHTLLGKYRLEQRLGSGTDAVAYLATERVTERRLVIKVPRSTDPLACERLRSEAFFAARVNAPTLATFYGLEDWCDAPCLLFEYMADGTLADMTRRGPLKAESALEAGIAIAMALEEIHAAGFLHGDIKPANVGLQGNRVKLLDFGVSSALAEPYGVSRTIMGQVDEHDSYSGTLLYASPEALDGQEANPAFDLWALSVTVAEGVLGEHPFDAGDWEATRSEIIRGVQQADHPRLTAIPAQLRGAFADMLAPSPADRPHSATAWIKLAKELLG